MSIGSTTLKFGAPSEDSHAAQPKANSAPSWTLRDGHAVQYTQLQASPNKWIIVPASPRPSLLALDFGWVSLLQLRYDPGIC